MQCCEGNRSAEQTDSDDSDARFYVWHWLRSLISQKGRAPSRPTSFASVRYEVKPHGTEADPPVLDRCPPKASQKVPLSPQPSSNTNISGFENDPSKEPGRFY